LPAVLSRVAGRAALAAEGRLLLALGDDPELATALRDRLDRAFLTILEVRAGEQLAAIDACRPWPWMVVGSGAGVDPGVVAELAGRPSLVVWRGTAPSGLPAHTSLVTRFSDVVALVTTALGAEVAGIRLAVGGGVTAPDGEHVASAALESLVAGHPRPLQLAPHQVRAVSRTLLAHGVPLTPVRVAGGVVLARADGE
jgi:hypothetical protein